MELVRMAAEKEISYSGARSKLAEILEKILKAELIRTGWLLEKTHDLNPNSEAEFRARVVAQASKPAVSQVSKLARRGSFRAPR